MGSHLESKRVQPECQLGWYRCIQGIVKGSRPMQAWQTPKSDREILFRNSRNYVLAATCQLMMANASVWLMIFRWLMIPSLVAQRKDFSFCRIWKVNLCIELLNLEEICMWNAGSCRRSQSKFTSNARARWMLEKVARRHCSFARFSRFLTRRVQIQIFQDPSNPALVLGVPYRDQVR